MRRNFRGIIVLALAVGSVTRADVHGQPPPVPVGWSASAEPVPVQPSPWLVQSPSMSPLTAAPPLVPLPSAEPPAADCSFLSQEITAHLQGGLPAGVRVEFPVARGTNRYTVAELFVGSEWTILVGTVGVRQVFEIPLGDGQTVFLVGPGLHALYVNALNGPRSSGGGGVVDTTLGWAFDRQRRGNWEFGLNLGLAVVAADNFTLPIPTFGLYTGCHF